MRPLKREVVEKIFPVTINEAIFGSSQTAVQTWIILAQTN